MNISEDVIYLTLDVGHQIDIAYDQDLKSILALMGDNNKYNAVIGMK